MTQYLMNQKSTKVMNFANSKSATRTYKMTARTSNSCSVAVKVNGREKTLVTFVVREGKLSQTSTNPNITPIDLNEVTSIAKKALKIS